MRWTASSIRLSDGGISLYQMKKPKLGAANIKYIRKEVLLRMKKIRIYSYKWNHMHLIGMFI